MELYLKTRLQHDIADLLWNATSEDVESILHTYGSDARLVYNMMIAAVFDDIDDTELAKKVLRDIFV